MGEVFIRSDLRPRGVGVEHSEQFCDKGHRSGIDVAFKYRTVNAQSEQALMLVLLTEICELPGNGRRKFYSVFAQETDDVDVTARNLRRRRVAVLR